MDILTDRLSDERRLKTSADFTARIYSGNLTAEDYQALQTWLSDSPENRAAYQVMLDTWHISGVVADRLDELELEDLDNDISVPAQRRSLRRWAAGFLLIMGCGLTVLFGLFKDELGWGWNDSQLTSYATNTGERRRVELSDGSAVTLNTSTRVLVDYSDARRRVMLERGEAFFEVESDPARPFVVDTGARAVTVLGTRFDIRKDGLRLEVAVVEGEVTVHRAEEDVTRSMQMTALLPDQRVDDDIQATQRYKLKAGVQAIFSHQSSSSTVVAVAISETRQYPDWRYGFLRFDDKPLYQVVKELNRYTQKKVLIEDNSVVEMKVSAVFQLEGIDKAVHNLEVALPLQIVQHPDRIVIVGK